MTPAAFLSLARLLPHGLLLVDRAGAVVAANPAAFDALGATSADQLQGRALASLSASDPERVAEVLRRFSAASEPVPAALALGPAGGAAVDCRLWGCRQGAAPDAPLVVRVGRREDQVDRFALLTRQVDELTREVGLRRQVEDERARALTREREARAIAEGAVEALRAAEATLRDAVAARDQFIAVASHELRTPLNALTLHLEGLALFASALDPRARKRLDGARHQVARFGRLIADLLDVSRITSGQLRIQPERLDMVAVVSEVAAREEEALDRVGCSLRLALPDRPIIGSWDRVRLEQVLLNFLHNAMRFGAGKPIGIEVARHGARARLTVADSGIGIAREDQARIFERFERAAPGKQFGGLGLGLWIVQQIARASGGTVHVESRPGEGARFSLELPLEPLPSGA